MYSGLKTHKTDLLGVCFHKNLESFIPLLDNENTSFLNLQGNSLGRIYFMTQLFMPTHTCLKGPLKLPAVFYIQAWSRILVFLMLTKTKLTV